MIEVLQVLQIVGGLLLAILCFLAGWMFKEIIELKLKNAKLEERQANFNQFYEREIKAIKDQEDKDHESINQTSSRQFIDLKTEIAKVEGMVSALHKRVDNALEALNGKAKN